MRLDGDAVAKAVLARYASLPSNGKPKSTADARGRPRVEWTVLAGFCIVKVGDAGGEPKVACVSLGTGLRCLPHARLPPLGDVLHDSHAEIIARRGLKLYLLQQIRLAQCTEDGSSVLDRRGDGDAARWRLRQGVRIAMYISTLPCGDASTYALSLLAPSEPPSSPSSLAPLIPSTILATSYGLQTSRASSSPSLTHSTLSQPPQVLRGRISYSTYNTLRTKPGRIDSPPSTSHSCSDKIALWILLGLQGGLLSALIGKIELSLLVIGGVQGKAEEREKIREEVEKSVKGRLQGWASDEENLLEIRLTKLSFSDAKPTSEDVQVTSCPESISYIQGLGTEIIVNGIRQGVSAKRKNGEALGVKARSRLSKLSIFNALSSASASALEPSLSYHSAKHSASTLWYQSIKGSVRGEGGPFEGWLVSGRELESFGLEGRKVA